MIGRLLVLATNLSETLTTAYNPGSGICEKQEEIYPKLPVYRERLFSIHLFRIFYR